MLFAVHRGFSLPPLLLLLPALFLLLCSYVTALEHIDIPSKYLRSPQNSLWCNTCATMVSELKDSLDDSDQMFDAMYGFRLDGSGRKIRKHSVALKLSVTMEDMCKDFIKRYRVAVRKRVDYPNSETSAKKEQISDKDNNNSNDHQNTDTDTDTDSDDDSKKSSSDNSDGSESNAASASDSASNANANTDDDSNDNGSDNEEGNVSEKPAKKKRRKKKKKKGGSDDTNSNSNDDKNQLYYLIKSKDLDQIDIDIGLEEMQKQKLYDDKVEREGLENITDSDIKWTVRRPKILKYRSKTHKSTKDMCEFITEHLEHWIVDYEADRKKRQTIDIAEESEEDRKKRTEMEIEELKDTLDGVCAKEYDFCVNPMFDRSLQYYRVRKQVKEQLPPEPEPEEVFENDTDSNITTNNTDVDGTDIDVVPLEGGSVESVGGDVTDDESNDSPPPSSVETDTDSDTEHSEL